MNTIDPRDISQIQAMYDGELTLAEREVLLARIAASPELQAAEREIRDVMVSVVHFMATADRMQPLATERLHVVPLRRPRFRRGTLLRAAGVLGLLGGAALAARIVLGGNTTAVQVAAKQSTGRSEVPVPEPAPLVDPRQPKYSGTAEEPQHGNVVVAARGLERIASREAVAGAPSGTVMYRLGDGSVLTLAYGEASGESGLAITTPDPAVIGDSTRSVRAGSGAARALTNDDIQPRPIAEECPSGIRWRDESTGLQVHLTGQLTCDQLRRAAARFKLSH